MAIKRKSKDPVRVVLPRRTKRQPKIRCKEAFWNFVPKKPLKNDTHINNLPDEVLLNIFCYFTTKQLYCQIRPVCRRWMVLTMSPILWRVIDVKNEVPTHVLTYWIKTSPLLKSFSIQNRNDADIIADQVNKITYSSNLDSNYYRYISKWLSILLQHFDILIFSGILQLAKCCKQLESIKMQNCWGSPKCCFIRSTPLCTLVTRCNNLYNFNFSQSRFVSRKFFRLISRDKRNGRIMKKCNYIGPMTVKQMRALFLALRDYEVHDTATIGNVNFTQKFKLRDIIRYFQEIQNPRQVVNDIWENLYYGHDEEEAIDYPMQMDA
ncbi:leucine-rich repeat domain superfamily [Holotrichia oblita]|uniref:Leucine-rich repeat domain superfamily n=1 Tax=Holotrichia oblita TaxID=644536 RepID=A0ACB9TG68_HOLOL|nr:leucine-rich repeat domain superfamily [Holotrichia oblita]